MQIGRRPVGLAPGRGGETVMHLRARHDGGQPARCGQAQVQLGLIKEEPERGIEAANRRHRVSAKGAIGALGQDHCPRRPDSRSFSRCCNTGDDRPED